MNTKIFELTTAGGGQPEVLRLDPSRSGLAAMPARVARVARVA